MPGKNTCNCPSPPGGKVECDIHQMAVCVIKNGQPKYLCLSPPQSTNSLELVNWAISEITGVSKFAYSEVLSNEIKFLLAKKYNADRMSVIFSLPRNIVTALNEIINNSGLDSGYQKEALVR